MQPRRPKRGKGKCWHLPPAFRPRDLARNYPGLDSEPHLTLSLLSDHNMPREPVLA